DSDVVARDVDRDGARRPDDDLVHDVADQAVTGPGRAVFAGGAVPAGGGGAVVAGAFGARAVTEDGDVVAGEVDRDVDRRLDDDLVHDVADQAVTGLRRAVFAGGDAPAGGGGAVVPGAFGARAVSEDGDVVARDV